MESKCVLFLPKINFKAELKSKQKEKQKIKLKIQKRKMKISTENPHHDTVFQNQIGVRKICLHY